MFGWRTIPGVFRYRRNTLRGFGIGGISTCSFATGQQLTIEAPGVDITQAGLLAKGGS